MSEEPVADDELRGLGMAAFHENEASVSDAETESALRAVRSRLASGLGGATSVAPSSAAPGQRPSWAMFAAAAAVVALIAGGLVVALGGSDDDTIVPASQSPVTSEAGEPTPSVAPETTLAVETTTPPSPTTTQVAVAFVRQTISVDAANPPPLIEPVVFTSVPAEADPNTNGVSVAFGAEGLVVKQPGTDFLSFVRRGTTEPIRIEIDEGVSNLVAGSIGVVYGLGEPVFDDDNPVAPRGFRFPAIALVGDRAGETVAVAEVDPNAFLEIPPFFFGLGADGVIRRQRQVGQEVIEHVDETGAPYEPRDVFPIPAFADIEGDGFRDVEGGLIEVLGSERSWQLDIRRDSTHADTFVGPSPPAPTTGGRVIYFERIGADLFPERDFGPNGLPVVAVLNPDGSGTWVRLPEDWDVVASDVWGTVLMRQTDTDLEFALLDEVLPPTLTDDLPPTLLPTTPNPDGLPPGGLAIPRNCVGDFQCTQLASTEDGRMVAYDPTDSALTVWDETGSILQDEISIGTSFDGEFIALEHIGPDDVAYVSYTSPDAVDPIRDLVAIPLDGPTAGNVVMAWSGLDGSGDSSLVPRTAGLVSVGCCGPAVARPSPDAPIFRFVDRNGSVVESTAPTFRLDLGEAGNNLVRINTDGTSTFFSLPTVFQYPRDIPWVVTTDEGGALAYDYVQLRSGRPIIVDFDLDWATRKDNGQVYYVEERAEDAAGVALLEPSGTVIVVKGGVFVRRTLDEIATPGWPGEFATDRSVGVTSAPGLNEYIDAEQSFWAADPELFAYQLKSTIGPNESVSIDFDESDSPIITITTTGFLDDSVGASQRVITTERGDDGLLRFVSGTYAFRCQPGRGHQDFSLELCI